VGARPFRSVGRIPGHAPTSAVPPAGRSQVFNPQKKECRRTSSYCFYWCPGEDSKIGPNLLRRNAFLISGFQVTREVTRHDFDDLVGLKRAEFRAGRSATLAHAQALSHPATSVQSWTGPTGNRVIAALGLVPPSCLLARPLTGSTDDFNREVEVKDVCIFGDVDPPR